MHFLQAINSDISVLIVCNKTGGTIKGDIKKINEFKSGGLHEKHAVATWSLGNHLSFRLETQGNQEKTVSRWPVAGPSSQQSGI